MVKRQWKAGLAANANGALVGHSGVTADREVTGVRAPTSASTGAPVLVEVETSGQIGLLMVTAEDAVHHFMRIPEHWNLHRPIEVRVIWTCGADAVGARTINWLFKYQRITTGVIRILVSGASTVLDTVIPLLQIPAGTARLVERTTPGVINAHKLTADSANYVPDYLSFVLSMSAFNAALSENKYLLGVEFGYYLKKSPGRRA